MVGISPEHVLHHYSRPLPNSHLISRSTHFQLTPNALLTSHLTSLSVLLLTLRSTSPSSSYTTYPYHPRSAAQTHSFNRSPPVFFFYLVLILQRVPSIPGFDTILNIANEQAAKCQVQDGTYCSPVRRKEGRRICQRDHHAHLF